MKSCRMGFLAVGLLHVVSLWPAERLVRATEPDRSRMPGLSYIHATGALTRMPDGRLMDWWSAGDKGAQRVVARVSRDEGRTWSNPQRLFDFPKEDGDYGTGYVNLVAKLKLKLGHFSRVA